MKDGGNQTRKLCRFGKGYDDAECGDNHDPVDKQCRFGDRCTKEGNCLFNHASGQQNSHPDGNIRHENSWSRRSMQNEQNTISNGKFQGQIKRLCRYGAMCVIIGCNFGHIRINKPCRHGVNCNMISRCLFIHKGMDEGFSGDGAPKWGMSTNGGVSALSLIHI